MVGADRLNLDIRIGRGEFGDCLCQTGDAGGTIDITKWAREVTEQANANGYRLRTGRADRERGRAGTDGGAVE